MDTGTLAIMLIFGLPIVAVITQYHRKVLEMKIAAGVYGQKGVAGLDEVRQELADLRDTATRYDLSFDAALQRMEQRLALMEKRVQTVEQSATVTQQLESK